MKKLFYGLIVMAMCQWSCEKNEPDSVPTSGKAPTQVQSAGTWTYLSPYPTFNGVVYYFFDPVTFAIGGKGYLVQFDSTVEYDPLTNSWADKMADLISHLYEANGIVGFSIGEFGYIGTGLVGRAGASDAPLSDFEQYDPKTNNWVAKNPVPIPLSNAVGFSIGDRGYIGLGYTGYEDYQNDEWTFHFSLTGEFFEYDPATDTWSKKAKFPGTLRQDAVGFSIGGKGYVGGGNARTNGKDCFLEDFWEYDPKNDKWTRKANFPGGPRAGLVAFGIRNKGYMGTGFRTPGWTTYDDFWEYDPAKNSWKEMPAFPGGKGAHLFGFTIGDKGFVGSPSGENIKPVGLWLFDPSK